jgi:hypothetical protein
VEIIRGHEVYGPGEVIKPTNAVADPVVVKLGGVPPIEVSRRTLAKQMQRLGLKQGESTLIHEQGLNEISGDKLAVLVSIQAALSDKHPVT